MNSLADIRRGLQVVIERAANIGPVLTYPPKSIPASGTVYLVRDGFEDAGAGNVRGVRWQFIARLVVLWQDAAPAEAELDSLTEAILEALAADRRLGGLLKLGIMDVSGGADGWFQMDGSQNWYRFCDLEINVLDKG